MLDERFDDKNSMDGTDAYSRLADCVEDEAYDGLLEFIQDEMDDSNTREYLINIAAVWQSRGTTQEKYAFIGDLFQGVVDLIAANKMKGN